MTDRPHRVQLRRVKDWRMPENTVSVARPSRWGNPYNVDRLRRGLVGALEWSGNPSLDLYQVWVRSELPLVETKDLAAELAVELFRRLCARFAEADPDGYEAWLAALRGKNLACYCPLDQPCHADVLLELANADKGGEDVP